MDGLHKNIFGITERGGIPNVMERSLQKNFLDALLTAAAEPEAVKINGNRATFTTYAYYLASDMETGTDFNDNFLIDVNFAWIKMCIRDSHQPFPQSGEEGNQRGVYPNRTPSLFQRLHQPERGIH